MRKLFFGLAFFSAMAFSNTMTIAQTDPPPLETGGDGGGNKICCLQIGAFCQDRFGNAYSDSIESPGPTCTRP